MLDQSEWFFSQCMQHCLPAPHCRYAYCCCTRALALIIGCTPRIPPPTTHTKPPRVKAMLCCICWAALDFGFSAFLLIFQVEYLSFNDLQGLDNSYSRVLKKNLSLHFCQDPPSPPSFSYNKDSLRIKAAATEVFIWPKRTRSCILDQRQR